MKLDFYHPATQKRSYGVFGFSWTTLFFQFLPALFRGHWTAALIQIIMAICSLGASFFVMPFYYNKWHAEWLSKNGFVLMASDEVAYKVRKKWHRLPINHSDQFEGRTSGKVDINQMRR